MPLLAGDIVLFSVQSECFGQRILFTHHYRASGTGAPAVPTSTALEEMLETMSVAGADIVESNYKACLPPDCVVVAARAQRITPNRSAYVQSEAWDGPGTYPTGTESSNQTAVLTLRTENAGRNQVSNKHIGPIPAAAQVNGYISDSYQGIIGVLGNSLRQSFALPTALLTMSPIIFHGPPTNTYDAITNQIVNRTVRTQRRRTVGLGE